ncbi:uncharacterized protein LOC135496599 [Lineus longissimus]|uniref:uncharacterized protein LOC135496599 n=1 Tax=Lineus longissimus TaxID=88925 RepID=UPI00315D119D
MTFDNRRLDSHANTFKEDEWKGDVLLPNLQWNEWKGDVLPNVQVKKKRLDSHANTFKEDEWKGDVLLPNLQWNEWKGDVLPNVQVKKKRVDSHANRSKEDGWMGDVLPNVQVKKNTDSNDEDSDDDIIFVRSSPAHQIAPSTCTSPATSITEDQEHVELFEGDGSMPLISRPKKGLAAREILALILQKPSEESVCVQKPIGVRKNAVFLVNLNSVRLDSLNADDNGAWKSTQPRTDFWVDRDEQGKVIRVYGGTVPRHASHQLYTLTRQYSVHKGTLSKCGRKFQRITSVFYDCNRNRCKYAVVQYLHEGDNEEVHMAPHGNSKTRHNLYYSTDPVVIENIEQSPKKVKKVLGMCSIKFPQLAGTLAVSQANQEILYSCIMLEGQKTQR